MGRLFEHPLYLLIVVVIIVLLFGAPKLPGMARSLGQSMRIFKSEVGEMKNDGKDKSSAANQTVDGQVVNNAPDQATTARNDAAPQQDAGTNRTDGAQGTGTQQ